MDQKKSILRTNSSVLGSMKWWPTNTNTATATTISENNKKPSQGFGSSIAVQKLRESKWFKADESRVLCAVIESGFIIETKEGQENDGWFGVVQCKTTKDKKPKPENVEIYTLKQLATDRRMKISKITLADIWNQGCLVRINNFGDKEKPPHSEKDIKNQIIFAQKAKQILWHNSQHFAYWSRYGERQEDVRRRQEGGEHRIFHRTLHGCCCLNIKYPGSVNHIPYTHLTALSSSQYFGWNRKDKMIKRIPREIKNEQMNHLNMVYDLYLINMQ